MCCVCIGDREECKMQSVAHLCAYMSSQHTAESDASRSGTTRRSRTTPPTPADQVYDMVAGMMAGVKSRPRGAGRGAGQATNNVLFYRSARLTVCGFSLRVSHQDA